MFLFTKNATYHLIFFHLSGHKRPRALELNWHLLVYPMETSRFKFSLTHCNYWTIKKEQLYSHKRKAVANLQNKCYLDSSLPSKLDAASHPQWHFNLLPFPKTSPHWHLCALMEVDWVATLDAWVEIWVTNCNSVKRKSPNHKTITIFTF